MTVLNVYERALGMLGLKKRDGTIDTLVTSRYNGVKLDVTNSFLLENNIHTVARSIVEMEAQEDDYPIDISQYTSATIEEPTVPYITDGSTIVIPAGFAGTFTLQHKTPVTVTDEDDELPTYIVAALTFYMCYMFMLSEDPGLANFFEQKYMEAKRKMYRINTVAIKNYYQ
jgi:hypothetical protein